MAMPDLQRYPGQLCLIKYELDINVFVSLNCLYLFAVSLRKWFAYFLLKRSNWETRRINIFSSHVNDDIFHILIRLKSQRYPCKSGIAIFAQRVTWNYAYSPFKGLKNKHFPQTHTFQFLHLNWKCKKYEKKAGKMQTICILYFEIVLNIFGISMK